MQVPTIFRNKDKENEKLKQKETIELHERQIKHLHEQFKELSMELKRRLDAKDNAIAHLEEYLDDTDDHVLNLKTNFQDFRLRTEKKLLALEERTQPSRITPE